MKEFIPCPKLGKLEATEQCGLHCFTKTYCYLGNIITVTIEYEYDDTTVDSQRVRSFLYDKVDRDYCEVSEKYAKLVSQIYRIDWPDMNEIKTEIAFSDWLSKISQIDLKLSQFVKEPEKVYVVNGRYYVDRTGRGLTEIKDSLANRLHHNKLAYFVGIETVIPSEEELDQ